MIDLFYPTFTEKTKFTEITTLCCTKHAWVIRKQKKIKNRIIINHDLLYYTGKMDKNAFFLYPKKKFIR